MKLAHRLTLLLSALMLSGTSLAATRLPEKAFDVEDGIVGVVAGVMPGPAATSALPIGKLKYPTRYFVEIHNESPYPLWMDAAWTFTDKGKASRSKTVRSKKIPPGGSYTFYSDKFGVIAGQPIVVDLDAWSDEKRTRRIGGQRAELVFEQDDIDAFLAAFPNAFKSSSQDYGKAVVISGWLDIPASRTDVPGTLADATLQADIQRLLWKTDSRQRFSCERAVVEAAPIDAADSEMLATQPGETRQQAQLDQFGDTLNVERWTVRSCGQAFTYEVLMSASRSGGSDIAIFAVSGGQSSQNRPEVAVVEQ